MVGFSDSLGFGRSLVITIDAAFTHFPALTTERLHLRQIQPQDAEALFAILSDEEAMRYYGHEPHRSLDKTLDLLNQIQGRYERRKAIAGVSRSRARILLPLPQSVTL